MTDERQTQWLNQREAEISEREQRATPGPWVNDGPDRFDENEGWVHVIDNPPSVILVKIPCEFPDHQSHDERLNLCGNAVNDTEFIAHARADIPYLLDTVTRLRESLKQCRSHWGGYCVTKDEQYKSLMEDFWAHIRKCDVLIDTALAEEKPNER